MKRNITTLLVLLSVVILQSCYKEEVYDENPFLVKKRPLNYEALKPSNSSLFTGDTVMVEALASGDSLKYNWSSVSGKLIPQHSKAQFTCDTPGNFDISCQITDKYGNTVTKQVSLLVAKDMVFSDLVPNEPLIPVNYVALIKASASGEGVTYEWSANGGEITALGDSALFKSSVEGKYSVTCRITDILGTIMEKVTEVEVINGFVYKEVTATPQEVKAGDFSEVEACVLGGDDCTYSWKSFPQGTIVGSGPKVLFTICHADVFNLSCMVTDRNGKTEIKSVNITVIN